MPTTYTPLRFPGGKSKIYPLVDSIIEENDLVGCTYSEAFCGGAGLAVKLLLKGRVSRIVLNDIDPAVYSAWDAIVNHANELCRFVSDVPLDIDEWKAMRECYQTHELPSLELGKAAFYLNRTNRSGILGGGVIGGLGQDGVYRMDARFNRDNLVEKVRAISARRDDIELHNSDVHDFMADVATQLPEDSLLYLDPPYVEKGPGLYENSFDEGKHRELADDVRAYDGNWMVTYDDDELVRRLYSPTPDWRIDVEDIAIGYSAATRRRASEVLVLGPGMVSSWFDGGVEAS